MKRIVPALFIVAGVVAVAAWLQPWAAAEAPEVADSGVSVKTVTAAEMGYRVSIDPATGELKDTVDPVDMKDLPESLQNALSTSSEGLTERPTNSPAGGMMIDLQGRFQNTSVARIDADGTLEAPCLTNENDLEAFVADVNALTANEEE